MEWTQEASDAIKKVPFFVRKKVKARVEKEAASADRKIVTLNDVKLTQKRYLTNMESEIRGFQLDTCFGGGGCPNSAIDSSSLVLKLEALLKEADLLGFLKQNVRGKLKFHHEFRITIADCPNACSQPQIKDIGIIGASIPSVVMEKCSRCGACVKVCKEEAINLPSYALNPLIDESKCLYCGKCAKICKEEALVIDKKGFRVFLGGKLGRHPRLAEPLGGLFNEDEVVGIVEKCISKYKEKSKDGSRFADIYKSGMIKL